MFRCQRQQLSLFDSSTANCSFRGIGSWYFRPRPRPYRRRLYETALAPILPKKLEREWKKANDPFNIYSASPEVKTNLGEEEFTQYEQALVGKLRKWIHSEHFRVVTVCQLNATKDETLWMARNQFRMDGLELCDFPCKILRKLFASTRLRPINSLLFDEFTCLLFGKGPECISSVFSLCSRYNWIHPLALTVDSRILTLEHAKEFADADSMDKLRFQTTQLFAQLSGQLPITFDKFTGQLSSSLDAHLRAASG